MTTWLSSTLGIDLPIVQAPMARVSEGRMAGAVSAAGALGMIGVTPGQSPAYISEQAEVAAAAGKPYGIGLLAWALADEPATLDAVADTDAMVVAVSFGRYEHLVEPLQAAGKVVTTQVGTLEEARRAERAGVDFVVARGGEGGGHGRNDVGTLPLLQMVLDEVEVPVVAAGGIATSRGVAAVLACGAVGAWVGTAFLCCEETTFPASARQRLADAGDVATAYGRVFDVAQQAAWPREYGGRALRNSFFDAWAGREDELAQDEAALAGYAAAQRARDFDTAVLYAGQGVTLLRSETTAAEVVASLAPVPS